jgi:hypothetical protein
MTSDTPKLGRTRKAKARKPAGTRIIQDAPDQFRLVVRVSEYAQATAGVFSSFAEAQEFARASGYGVPLHVSEV